MSKTGETPIATRSTDRRRFLELNLGVAASLLAAPALARDRQPGSTSKPNILMIVIDDLNDWIGAMGGHPGAITPNIDRLAARGSLFLNAHAQAPMCGPSRASFHSGLMPSTTGIYGFVGDADLRTANPAMENVEFLTEYFGTRGYHTAAVGKIFHQGVPAGTVDRFGGRFASPENGRPPNEFGPRPSQPMNWDGQEVNSTDWGPYPDREEDTYDYQYAQWAAEYLEQACDEPFFLSVGFIRPHVPWHAPKKWFDLHPLETIQMPPYFSGDLDDVSPLVREAIAKTTRTDYPSRPWSADDEAWKKTKPGYPNAEWALKSGEWREIVQAYLACVSFADHCAGIVLDALDRSGRADDTIVVLWSDQGYHLGEKNHFDKKTPWDRTSRVPLIFAGPGVGGGSQVSRAVGLIDVYPTLVDLAGLEPNRRNEGRSLGPLLADPARAWPYPSIMNWAYRSDAIRTEDYRYIQYEDGSEELYDHRVDPQELHNVAGKAEYAGAKKQLAKFLPRSHSAPSPKTYVGRFPQVTAAPFGEPASR